MSQAGPVAGCVSGLTAAGWEKPALGYVGTCNQRGQVSLARPAAALESDFAGEFVRGREGREVLASLLRGYLDRGGGQIQLNIVAADTLRRARQAPGEHRDVIVRVAGFCEYFVNLDGRLQDEIISRTAEAAGV